MISEARAVRLSRKERDVLEGRCRSPVTIQRDLKRARIVLLAAAGRNTRSIAKEVGVQPRIVSHWRRRFADDGLEGLQDKPRPGKGPIYTKETDKRILAFLDKPPPKGFARWTGPLLAACAIRRSIIALQLASTGIWEKAPPEVFISGIRSRVDKDVLTHLSDVLGVDVEHTAAVRDHPIFFVYEDLPKRRTVTLKALAKYVAEENELSKILWKSGNSSPVVAPERSDTVNVRKLR